MTVVRDRVTAIDTTGGRVRGVRLASGEMLATERVVLWALFADRLIRETTEEAASQSLGTEVDIGRFRILETQAAVEMGP